MPDWKDVLNAAFVKKLGRKERPVCGINYRPRPAPPVATAAADGGADEQTTLDPGERGVETLFRFGGNRIPVNPPDLAAQAARTYFKFHGIGVEALGSGPPAGSTGPGEVVHAGLLGALVREFVAAAASGHETDGTEAATASVLDWAGLAREWRAFAKLAESGALPGNFLREFVREFFGDAEVVPFELPPAPPAGVVGHVVTPAALGCLGEGRFGGRARNLRGSFFTPPAEVSFTCRRALYHWLRNWLARRGSLRVEDAGRLSWELAFGPARSDHSIEPPTGLTSRLARLRVLVPACGAGGFLVGVADMVLSAVERSARRLGDGSCPAALAREAVAGWLARGNLAGVEVDPWSRRLALVRSALWSVARLGATPPAARVDLADFLTDWRPPAVGFDLIVGNPPYVRHRDLAPPAASAGTWGALDQAAVRAYRELVRKRAVQALPAAAELSSRSDAQVYFFSNGLSLLREGGVLGFVTSNSWLDVGYGFRLQKLLLEHAVPLEFVDCAARSFADAEVNTVVCFVRKTSQEERSESDRVEFVRFPTGYERALEVMGQPAARGGDSTGSSTRNSAGSGSGDLSQFPGVRSRTVTARRLWALGGGSERERGGGRDYRGARWGNLFFKAPDAYLDLLDECAGRWVRLGDVATVRRGMTTGCNAFFHLDSWNDLRNGLGHPCEAEPEFLVPVVTSPKDLARPLVDPAALRYRVFVCDLPREELPPGARRYVEGGERALVPVRRGAARGTRVRGVHQLATFRQRKGGEWYRKSPSEGAARVFVQKIFHASFKVGVVPAGSRVVVNNTFYAVGPKRAVGGGEGELPVCVVASVVSTLGALGLELNGRANFGGGALDTATFDLENVPVLDPAAVPSKVERRLESLLRPVLQRPFLPLSRELSSPDRRALDACVLEALGADRRARASLHRGLRGLVAARASKARTFGGHPARSTRGPRSGLEGSGD
ncbi:MAG: hypothetical protein Kow0069_25660 [Promethearchaeota archaeon]